MRKTPIRGWPTAPLLAGLLLGCASGGEAQDLKHCEPVHRFLTEQFAMVAEVGPDTIDDWRTHKIVPGCRVTAAGGSPLGLGHQAGMLYDQLMAAGWTRTPEPRDAPDEAALRLRLAQTDCFFTPYSGIAIGTDAERRVTMAFVPNSEDARYNMLVQCMPALPAAP
jgi:hypothetical protein